MEAIYGTNLQNYQNYGIYESLVRNGFIQIDTTTLNKENIDDHFYCILNILRDGVESDYVQHMAINVVFADRVDVSLSIFDYLLNVMMWTLPAKTDDKITSYYLFFPEKFNKNSIKEYIDIKFLNKNRTKFSNKTLCNIIDDTVYKLRYVDEFSLYLCNTINDEDTIDLMNQNPEFYKYIHPDLSNYPLEDVKNIGMDITNKVINIIENSNHCLADSFATGEGINRKQFREFQVNIGTVPDGDGGVFPLVINSSFSNEGLQNPEDLLAESAKGRIAQIYAKKNVGTSGAFARILGLNNRDTRLHIRPKYSCGTKNLLKITIVDKQVLKMYNNRYYRFTLNGPEYKLNYRTDSHLIGQTLLFRSPVTCASFANGNGICYRCYGDLAYTNYDINIGTIAAEILSSELTQMLLSAKHLLESNIKKMDWSEGFYRFFDVNYNIIHIRNDFECAKWKIRIDSRSVSDEEGEEYEISDTINNFEVVDPKGKSYPIYLENGDSFGFAGDLAEIISTMQEPIDGDYEIDMESLIDKELFLIHIANDELSVTLEHVKNVISKLPKQPGMNKDLIIQEFVNAVIKGHLSVTAIHLEVIIANQIRKGFSDEDILEKPDWTVEDAPYALVNLDTALKKNPSVTTTLEYQKIGRALFNPLTYKKTMPSQTDLYFMKKPQDFMNINSRKVKLSPEDDDMVKGMIYVEEEQTPVV